ncbi:MAG TPA: FG-GAP-like repeat-containing protein [Patescibacteria group bacterium]|nr:FG-GAP-like repeat-containing protein [Patescibacteria group bacterium]
MHGMLRRFFPIVPLVCLFSPVAESQETGRSHPLVWEQGEGYRRARLNVPPGTKAGFTLMPPERTGMTWSNRLSLSRVNERQNLMNGAGVAAGDFDGDGLADLYFCNKEGANALYRNLGGWRFEDVAQPAGVTCTNQSSTGVTFADLNGDGRLDLIVNSFTGPNACFLNLGNGRFTNITEMAGLLSKGGTTSLALSDLEGTGNLDLYVAYFGTEAILRDGAALGVRMVNGKMVIGGRYARRIQIINNHMYELGEPSMLFHNDGAAHFAPLRWEALFRDEDNHPISAPLDLSLAVQIRDINGDGLPDIYVCNDFQTPDRLWLNDGTGHFRAVDRLALRNMSFASMGVDFADVDRDGGLDFITVEMLSRDHEHHLRQMSPMNPKVRVPGELTNREEVARNAFYWSRGDGTYAEIAYYAGLAASDWSWCPIFLDVDLDGYEDLLISNGHMLDVNDRDATGSLRPAELHALRMSRKLILQYPQLNTPKAAFRNRGDLTFEHTGEQWGFNSTDICHGMALVDLDNDGDLDVVLNRINGPPVIYRNDCPAPRLAVRLKGKGGNRFGIGARIEVTGGPVPVQTQEMLCGGRYLSGDDTMRVFAAGTLTNSLTIKVTWRNGTRSVVNNALPNYEYEVDEAGAKPYHNSEPAAYAPWFKDVSELLSHKHAQPERDDFARQALLPHKYSQLGPWVAWCDLDGDGWDDLVIGSGAGGKLGVFRNNGAGGFEPWADGAWNAVAPEDQAAVVGVPLGSASAELLVGSGDYATAGPSALLQYGFHGRQVTVKTNTITDIPSPGPIALADLSGEGMLELFVGGRLAPGRYPEPVSSSLYKRSGAGWQLDQENSQVLNRLGLVSAAVFSDLDGDGYPELIVACEWGPVRVFKNDHGRLKEATAMLGLQKMTGLWTSVTTGDLDGDGRPDIIAGNWGLNSYYNTVPTGPWQLYYGDLNGDGQVSMLETYFYSRSGQTVPLRDMDDVAQGMPWVRGAFSTHRQFASLNIQQLLGDRFSRAKQLEVSSFASMVLFNRGDHFEAVPLPRQAQWAPAFGLAVADFDGDGFEDVFLAQNFFAVRAEDDRLDAGRGLWLRGDGRGQLKAVPGQESGIKVYGEQRGAALSDYDADGRVDIVITQNAAETRLFHNERAKPGLRVRLQGPDGNPAAIGALMRLEFTGRTGPAREIHAGSGYWSGDSSVQVLGTPEEPAALWVRWPGGKTTTTTLPKGAHEVVVNQSGQLVR